MQATIDIELNGDIFAELKKLRADFDSLKKSAESVETSTKKGFGGVNSMLKQLSFTNITSQLQNLSSGLQDINAPGMTFTSSLAEVSAITGVTGSALDDLAKKAKASAAEFGGSASESLESYKTILSRLGPDIAKSPKALEEMERSVRILSKSMGGDTTGSVDALTTSLLQYGVDLSNPIEASKEMTRMMNVMAAGAQEGAAEVPQVSAALKVAGVALKQAKVDFEAGNAALQALAAGGKEGAEAGVALRNVLGKMAGEDVLPKEAAEKLKRLGVDMRVVSDTSLPFTARLRELAKAQGDATIMAQVFGTENAAAANILLSSVDAQDELRKQITGTTSAVDQAAIVMESREEKLARFNASIENSKIAFFEATGGATAYLEPLAQLGTTFSSFVPLVSMAGSAFKTLGSTTMVQSLATKTATAAQWLWNAAMTANPIGLIIAGVAAAAAGIYALSKAFDTSTLAQRTNAAVTKEVNMAMVQERVNINALFEELKRTNPGTQERVKLVEEMKQKYPGLLEQYDLERAKLDEINVAQKDLIKSTRERLINEIKMKKATELLQEAEDMKDDNAYWGYWGNEDKWNEIKEIQKEADRIIDDVNKSTAASTNKANKANEQQQKALEAGYTSWSEYEKSGWKWKGKGEDPKKTENTTTPTPSASPSPKGYGDKQVVGAGGEMKQINVRIESLLSGDIVINSTTIKEGSAQLKDKITEALVSAVRDFEVAL